MPGSENGVRNRVPVSIVRLLFFQFPDCIIKEGRIQIDTDRSTFFREPFPVFIVICRKYNQVRIIHGPFDRIVRHIIVCINNSLNEDRLNLCSLLKRSVDVGGNQLSVVIQNLCRLHRIFPIACAFLYNADIKI